MTFIPTLLHSQTLLFRDLLNSLPCPLPCFLGITPGTTTTTEAISTLLGLGASYLGGDEDSSSGNSWFSIFLDTGHPVEAGETPSPFDSLLRTHIIVVANPEGNIRSIWVRAYSQATSQSRSRYREYYSHYDARGIMAQLGPPSQVFTPLPASDRQPNALLLFDYTRLGAFISLRSTTLENNICSEGAGDEGFISLDLRLFQPSPSTTAASFISLEPPASYWVPIEDVYGMTAEQYYARIVQDPKECFNP